MIPVIVGSILIQRELIAVVLLSVSIEQSGTAVGVVMSLQYHINVIFIKYRRQLCTQDHAVRVGVIQSGTVNILMNGHDSPCGIRICLSSLLDQLLMLCNIVIIGVQHDKQTITVGVVVVAASCGCAVLGSVGIVKVIHIIFVQRVVISDGGGYCQSVKRIGSQVSGVLFLFGLAGLIHLVPCGDYKVQIRILLQRIIQRSVPSKSIIAGSRVGSAALIYQLCAVLGLSGGSTDLGITYIQDFYRIRALGGVLAYFCLLPIFFYRIVIGGVGLQTCYGYMVICIGSVAGQFLVHISGSTGEGF